MEDIYTKQVLEDRWINYASGYNAVQKYKKMGLPIRCQNPPEDITENITKFIIQNYDNDPSCKWAKCIGKTGDLYSEKYTDEYPIEVKSFTSDGPMQFGPDKKFGVLYFLDLRQFTNNSISLWKLPVHSDSSEFQQIYVNKKETIQIQSSQGRRPHISWDKFYQQIKDKCCLVYKGTFENIFNPLKAEEVLDDSQSTEQPEPIRHFPQVYTNSHPTSLLEEYIPEETLVD